MTYFCPCYTAGKTAEAMGENCVLHAIACYLPLVGMICRSKIRSKIRESKGIEGSGCGDCLSVTFCSLCTLVQEARVRRYLIFNASPL